MTLRSSASTGGPAMPRPSHDAGPAYRFESFRTGLLIDDLWFSSQDPGPGDQVPAFAVDLLDGGTFSDSTLGSRPVLMVFGSRTCPVTESAAPRLAQLHREFGDDVRFVFINTREAHPGDLIPQPSTPAQKRAHAEALRQHHGIAYEVAVDDIDGTVHRRFSPKPNSAYLVRPDGTVAYRAHWANDDAGLRRAVTALLAGAEVRGTSRAMVGPLMRAVGHLPGIVRAGGSKIERDVWRAAPPLAVLASLSRLMPSVPVERRGPLAAALLVAATSAVAAIILVIAL
ncbi:redoxin domain-containing protein [Nocardioides dilutus]